MTRLLRVLVVLAIPALVPLAAPAAATAGTALSAQVPAWTRRAARPKSAERVRHRQNVPAQAIRVYDGDTFYVGIETIRLRGIDTPEIGQARAAAAARRLLELLSFGPIVIVRRGQDVYGRTLADVFVAGRNVARILRAEGYAKPRPPPGVRIFGHSIDARRMRRCAARC